MALYGVDYRPVRQRPLSRLRHSQLRVSIISPKQVTERSPPERDWCRLPPSKKPLRCRSYCTARPSVDGSNAGTNGCRIRQFATGVRQAVALSKLTFLGLRQRLPLQLCGVCGSLYYVADVEVISSTYVGLSRSFELLMMCYKS